MIARRVGQVALCLWCSVAFGGCGAAPATAVPTPTSPAAVAVTRAATGGTRCAGPGCITPTAGTGAAIGTPPDPGPSTTPRAGTPVPMPATSAATIPPTRGATSPALSSTASPQGPLPTVGPPPTAAPPTPVPPTLVPTPPPSAEYPADLNITSEITITFAGQPLRVGLPTAYASNSQGIAAIALGYLQTLQSADEAFLSLDEARLVQLYTGRAAEGTLPAFREVRDAGHTLRFIRQRRALAVASIAGDRAGIYDDFDMTIITLEAATGREIERAQPERRRIAVVIERDGADWRMYDQRGVR